MSVVSRIVLISLVASCVAAHAAAQPAPIPPPASQGTIVSVQGRVERAAAARSDAWSPATLKQPLFVDDRVRTLASSRAAILFIDETQVRLNAQATLTVQAIRKGTSAPTSLDLLGGEGWFRTKNPASGLTIKTPAATAAIRGTEINLRVSADGESILTVVEGSAAFFNDAGSLVAAAGEEARARPGQAPTKRTILNPDDAVQWALYYPVRVAASDLPAALPGPARESFERLRAGDAATALGSLASLPADDPWRAIGEARAQLELGRTDAARDALQRLDGRTLSPEVEVAWRTERASLSLAEGQVANARSEIDRALAIEPGAVQPLVLRSTIDLVTNRRAEAAEAAQKALAAHPNSVGALVAASEAAQAAFDLDAARELLDRAIGLDPADIRARVNRARIRFGTGDTRGAREDGAAASAIAPDDAQVRSLLGFIRLADGDVRAAAAEFERAVASDRELGEPYLGLGLVAFHESRVAEGLEAMLTATLVEPKVSLYQSYLGKAYYQARRFPEGLAALASAKRLDPRDPTPWLYASLFERDQNRQVAALGELRNAIARNDNRAVYRSRLLLDRDEATANVSLAEIYRQLGFEAWGAAEAIESVEADATNASAHLFLGDTYGLLADRTQALSSELLQYQLYSPVNRNSFNNFAEYTALLEQPYAQVSVTPGIGSDGWWTGTVNTRSGNQRFAHLAFIERDEEDGARPDEPDTKNQVFLQAKVSITPRDDVFVAFEDNRFNDGQSATVVKVFGIGFDSVVLRQYVPEEDRDPNRTTKLTINAGTVGYKHEWMPGSAFTAVLQLDQTTSRETDPDATVSACVGFDLEPFGAATSYELELPFNRTVFQAQQATRIGRHQLVGGALVFRQRKERRCHEQAYYVDGSGPFGVADEVTRVRDHDYRGYLRDEIALGHRVHATVGIAYDDVRYGDQFFDQTIDLVRWSPLAGVSVEVAPNTIVRAAAFRHLSADFFGSRIAPVTVSSFVIERNEVPTTIRSEYGVAFERAWGRAFAGVRVFVRDTEVPALMVPDLPSPRADVDTRGFGAYLNLLLGPRWSAFADNQWRRDETSMYFQHDNVARAGLNLTLENGLIARLIGSYITQSFDRTPVQGLPESSFMLADFEATWQFAAKHGLATFRVNNIFDRRFAAVVEGLSIDNIVPDRRVYTTLRWRF